MLSTKSFQFRNEGKVKHELITIPRKYQLSTTVVKIKDRKYQILVSIRNNWNFYALLMGIKNEKTSLQKGWAVSYKVKDTI